MASALETNQRFDPQRTFILFPDGNISEDSWSAALAHLDDEDVPYHVNVLMSGSGGSSVNLRWFAASPGDSECDFNGPDQVVVLGAAETFRRYLERNTSDDGVWTGPDLHDDDLSTQGVQEDSHPLVVAAPLDIAADHDAESWPRRWLHDLSIEVIGGVLVIVVIAVVGVLWTVLF